MPLRLYRRKLRQTGLLSWSGKVYERFMPAACSLLVFFSPVGVTLGAADRQPNGRQVYRQLCAKCHGRNGEGVKGKHNDPLQGERPLDKLTHYIERKMPEDHPGACTGPQAAAVARFIYDSFYSREARLRKNPPRLELAHLTNRQYVNSVADLINQFTGAETPTTGEPGLRATYYGAKDFNGDKKLFDRTDRQVAFDFLNGDDKEKLSSTNGCSVTWRGSLRAEETGDYEFLLQTPNGVRLWVNDDSEPLIDAWVASGQVREHKATRRLIAGRLYPLRLDYFRFKEKTAALTLLWAPPHGVQETIPARNLCTSKSSPTFVATTHFPADDSSLGYERGTLVSKEWDEATTSAAIELANYVTAHLDQLAHTKPDVTNRSASVIAFCRRFTASAWRHPLTDEQARAIVSGQFQPGLKIEDAVKRVVLLALKSPEFLYPGLGQQKPGDFEMASCLALGLWDSLPDEGLMKLASQGQLHTRAAVAQEARRVLEDPRTHAKMRAFFHHWLQVDRIENVSKDQQLFPGFTPAIIADLRTSLNLFLDRVLWGTNDISTAASGSTRCKADYRELLTADYLFLNNRLGEFYGVATNVSDDFVKTQFAPAQRSGVLTHPYLLAMFSYQKMTSPIHRGVFLTRNIVGRSLRPPPMAMTFKDADFAPDLTMREKVAQLTRPEACQGCHSVINPLGFSLEQFDAVGRFRTTEHEKPVNPISDYLNDDGETIHLEGPRDIANFAIHSEQAQNAFIEQLFHHLVKQGVLAYGADTLARLRTSFVGSNFDIQELMVQIVTVAATHDLEKSS